MSKKKNFYKTLIISCLIVSLFFTSSMIISKTIDNNAYQFITKKAFTTKPPFINIQNIIPNSIIDIRYATTNNFMNIVLNGYKKPYCWVRPKTAYALRKVQNYLKKLGFSLKFFDCYRPLKAVKHMIDWVRTRHPDWLGIYVSRRINLTSKYGHSSGNTVDITIVSLKTGKPLDMGTGFDDFRKLAWTHNARGQILRNRMVLYRALIRFGFKNFYTEWWHYTYHGEPALPLDIDIE